jgi:hypothetical protein
VSTNEATLFSSPHEVVTTAIKQAAANEFNAAGRELLHGVPAGLALL